MVEPDGLNRSFGRIKPKSGELSGQGNWKAEINGDTITAWADCGWKLVYTKGKLTAIGTPKGRVLDFVYAGKKVTEIREKGVTRFAVDFDPSTGEARALTFNGKKVELAFAPRPRVQTIAGQNVVAGVDPSLCRLSSPGLGAREFEFAVSEKVEPTLKITEATGAERKMAWDPATKFIAKDGDWAFQITPGVNSYDDAAIRRTNSQKQSEFWSHDASKGTETIEKGGVKYIYYSFLSGTSVGQLRKIVKVVGTKESIIYHATYGVDGTLLRRTGADGRIEFERGNPTAIYGPDNETPLFLIGPK